LGALEELERYAVKHASEAVRFDRRGAWGLAITEYQKAVEILLKLCSLYPKSPHYSIYISRVEEYRKRIKELQGGNGKPQTLVEKTAEKPPKKPYQLSEKPTVKWNDIADLENAKKAILESVVYPSKRPDLFPLGWPRGILLYGPPGCGKTLLAAATANEIDANFYCVDASSIMSKWLGESEKNVAKLFGEARAKSEDGKPSIIFIDEIDSLIAVRSEEVGGEARARNQFLKEMDGILDKGKNFHVYVFGATNKPWILDEPFIRRFQKRIYVPLPNLEARRELIKIYSRELSFASDVDLEKLAQLTEGYAGSDIRDLFQAAQIKIVREFFQSGGVENPEAKPRPISMEDLLEALNARKPSVSKTMLQAYEKWSADHGAL
jgi:SpoVK/Ycf46/Vps4 family AAA+-type ATPase